MDKKIVRSSKTPAWTDPISPATVWEGLVFCSGVVGADTTTLQPISDDIGGQTRQALRHLEATLEEAGSSLEHVLKVNAYLSEPADFDEFNKVFAEEFPELPPARSTVGVTMIGEYRIEIDLVAYVPSAGADKK